MAADDASTTQTQSSTTTSPQNSQTTPKSTAKKSTAKKSTAKKSTAKKSTAKKSTAASSTSGRAARKSTAAGKASTAEPTRRPQSAKVHLPFVNAGLRVPNVPVRKVRLPQPWVLVPAMHLPGRREVADATRVAGSWLPPREQMVLYGGLGAGALVGLIDWPVAVAVAAGSVVAKRGRGAARAAGPGSRDTTAVRGSA